MTLILPQKKAPYPSSIPKFDFPVLTEEDYERYKNDQFVVFSFARGGLPVVITVHSDRLHIYDDTGELKYNAFAEDLYSKSIGAYEVVFRKHLAGHVFYGWVYPNPPRQPIELFHVWNFDKKVWLDTKQTAYLSKSNRPMFSNIGLPNIAIYGTLEGVKQKINVENDWVFVKSINDPGLFFVMG